MCLCTQSTPTFTFLLTSLEAGLKSLDVAISSASATAVDNIASFYFRNVVQGVSAGSIASFCFRNAVQGVGGWVQAALPASTPAM